MGVGTVAEDLVRGTMLEGLAHAAYLPVLVLHISAGIAAMLAGAAALLVSKGAPWHRTAGRVFLASMLVAGVTAVPIAEARVSFITGPLAVYFAATAWMSARRAERSAGLFAFGALALALAVAATYFIFGAQAAASPAGALDGFPASFHYALGALAALAALLDLHAMLRRTLAEPARIARHLWRMCMALWMAATSFFFGQMDRFPEWVREAGFNIAMALLPLALMLFWLMRVLLMKRYAAPSWLKAPARIGGVIYLTAVGAGLLGLLLPRG